MNTTNCGKPKIRLVSCAVGLIIAGGLVSNLDRLAANYFLDRYRYELHDRERLGGNWGSFATKRAETYLQRLEWLGRKDLAIRPTIEGLNSQSEIVTSRSWELLKQFVGDPEDKLLVELCSELALAKQVRSLQTSSEKRDFLEFCFRDGKWLELKKIFAGLSVIGSRAEICFTDGPQPEVPAVEQPKRIENDAETKP